MVWSIDQHKNPFSWSSISVGTFYAKIDKISIYVIKPSQFFVSQSLIHNNLLRKAKQNQI